MSDVYVTVESRSSLSVRTVRDGKVHRHVVTPNDDISGESQAVKDVAAKVWTDDVKREWRKIKDEDERRTRKLNARRNA